MDDNYEKLPDSMLADYEIKEKYAPEIRIPKTVRHIGNAVPLILTGDGREKFLRGARFDQAMYEKFRGRPEVVRRYGIDRMQSEYRIMSIILEKSGELLGGKISKEKYMRILLDYVKWTPDKWRGLSRNNSFVKGKIEAIRNIVQLGYCTGDVWPFLILHPPEIGDYVDMMKFLRESKRATNRDIAHALHHYEKEEEFAPKITFMGRELDKHAMIRFLAGSSDTCSVTFKDSLGRDAKELFIGNGEVDTHIYLDKHILSTMAAGKISVPEIGRTVKTDTLYGLTLESANEHLKTSKGASRLMRSYYLETLVGLIGLGYVDINLDSKPWHLKIFEKSEEQTLGTLHAFAVKHTAKIIRSMRVADMEVDSGLEDMVMGMNRGVIDYSFDSKKAAKEFPRLKSLAYMSWVTAIQRGNTSSYSRPKSEEIGTFKPTGSGIDSLKFTSPVVPYEPFTFTEIDFDTYTRTMSSSERERKELAAKSSSTNPDQKTERRHYNF